MGDARGHFAGEQFCDVRPRIWPSSIVERWDDSNLAQECVREKRAHIWSALFMGVSVSLIAAAIYDYTASNHARALIIGGAGLVGFVVAYYFNKIKKSSRFPSEETAAMQAPPQPEEVLLRIFMEPRLLLQLPHQRPSQNLSPHLNWSIAGQR